MSAITGQKTQDSPPQFRPRSLQPQVKPQVQPEVQRGAGQQPWVAARTGATAAVMVDGFLATTPRGKGGALIAGAIELIRSVKENDAAVRAGTLRASEGALNVVGDTAIAASAGATGALIGGWIGSAIPVPILGTLAGAYLGAEIGGWMSGALHERLDSVIHTAQHKPVE